jgi:hypothetical protein
VRCRRTSPTNRVSQRREIFSVAIPPKWPGVAALYVSAYAPSSHNILIILAALALTLGFGYQTNRRNRAEVCTRYAQLRGSTFSSRHERRNNSHSSYASG